MTRRVQIAEELEPEFLPLARTATPALWRRRLRGSLLPRRGRRRIPGDVPDQAVSQGLCHLFEEGNRAGAWTNVISGREHLPSASIMPGDYEAGGLLCPANPAIRLAIRSATTLTGLLG